MSRQSVSFFHGSSSAEMDLVSNVVMLMTDFHDRLRVSLTAKNRAFHDSIHRYRKLD